MNIIFNSLLLSQLVKYIGVLQMNTVWVLQLLNFRRNIFINREFVTLAKKFANFNEFSEITKKIVKIRTKIR